MTGWLALPKSWLSNLGEITRFGGRVMGQVYSGRVMSFFGEALRQAGILIFGSALVIWGLVFFIGLQCGLEGAYLLRAQGAPAYAGVFSAWCDLRELVPYAFGYMMAAKVGTGIVAELGSMRISDEIDALEVMGVQPMVFLGRDAAVGLLDRPALHLPDRDRGRLHRQLPRRRAPDRRHLLGRLLPDLLDVPEPARPACSA